LRDFLLFNQNTYVQIVHAAFYSTAKQPMKYFGYGWWHVKDGTGMCVLLLYVDISIEQ